MNLALDHCAEDNPILDELVCWPPREQAIRRIRASSTLFRRPFIEVELEDGEVFQSQFLRDGFAEYWAEAKVVLQTLTEIELITEFRQPPHRDAEALRARVLATRDECIAESDLMYDEGMYQQFLMQYGPDCRDLPERTLERIANARRKLDEKS